jgi:hypothetical protein
MPTRLNQLRTPLYHPRILPRWIQAEAYLAGKGCEGERCGFFGRRYSQLTIELDGQAYLFKGRRL